MRGNFSYKVFNRLQIKHLVCGILYEFEHIELTFDLPRGQKCAKNTINFYESKPSKPLTSEVI